MSTSATATALRIIENFILTSRRRQLSQAQIAKEVGEIAAGRKAFVKDGLLGRRELTDVPSHQGAENTIPPHGTGPITPADFVLEGALARAERSLSNACKALRHTLAELDTDEVYGQPPEIDDEVKEDWIYRWRDAAGEVSSEDMQVLWGKVLAGEIRHPGAFSLRTLDFLRNLSPDEAKLIELLAQFAIDNQWIDFNAATEFGEPSGLNAAAVVRLQHIGVLVGLPPSLLGQKRTLQPVSTLNDTVGLVLKCGGHCLFVSAPFDHPEHNFEIQSYFTTQTGQEVLNLAGPVDANVPYIRFIGRQIGEQNPGFKVQLSRFRNISDKETRMVDPIEQLWPASSASAP